jgi:hypothetical protein
VEVVQGIGASVDLNSTQKCQSLLDSFLSSIDNISYKNVLAIIKSIWKLLHTVVGIVQTLSEREDELLHSALLEIRELLQFGCDFGTSIGDSLEVFGGSNGRSTATINEGNSRSLDLSDNSIFGNTNVRAVDQEAVSIIGNVSTHGTKSSVSSEGESRETSQVEVVSVDLVQVILQVTSEFIAVALATHKRKGYGDIVSIGQDR